MSNKIEILENTITKLLFRRGTDSDRQNVVLSLGEPGFTTDTNRLFIGNGVLSGGVLAGNKYLGEVTSPTSISTALTGDLVYATKSGFNQYYTAFIKTTNTNDLTSWTPVVPVAATPKAWVNFDGTATTGNATINSSYNVSSVSAAGLGDFIVNFTNAFSTSAYAVVFGNSGAGSTLQIKTDNSTDNGTTNTTKTTTFVRVTNTNSNGALTGTRNANVFIYTS